MIFGVLCQIFLLMLSFLSKKVSIFYIILFSAITGLVTFFVEKALLNEDPSRIIANESVNTSEIQSNCNYNIKRMEGFGYIRPLLFVDNSCESSNFNNMKGELMGIIDTYKKSGVLTSSSVYLKEYNDNSWMSINEDEKFMPGSLLKVPELITFLKMNELKPGTLDKELMYDHEFTVNKQPKFLSQSIQIGHKYTIRQLLTYMIAYSDNNATMLLNANIDVAMFKKTFTDFGLAAPDWNSSNYPISAKDFSLFMRALYNACYLTKANSEFATELLSKCDFMNGMMKGLPENIKVAHKFGEAGNQSGLELHESGIIYLNNTAYLITIMTKGRDLNKLPDVIREISAKVYQNMINRKAA